MKPILQNAVLIGIGWMLSLVIESTLFATLWAGLLGVIIFCTTKLCQVFDYQCPVADSSSSSLKKAELSVFDKGE